MTKATLIRDDIFGGAGLQFRGLVQYCHGRKHGGMKAGAGEEA